MISENLKINLDLFYSKIEKTNYCWNWTCSLDNCGYGYFSIYVNGIKKAKKAHRIAYSLHHQNYDLIINSYDRNKTIGHTCNNKKCCNPDHLELITQDQNSTNASLDGLYQYGENHHKTKLSYENVLEIRSHNNPKLDKYFADKFNVSESLIQKIRYKKIRLRG
jgi:hypothetical protein